MGTPSSLNASVKPPRRRRWIPVSLKMFVAMLIILGVGSVLRVCVPAYRQYVAVREIERAGGFVLSAHGGPEWLRQWLGDEWMKVADEVNFLDASSSKFTDVEMVHVKELVGIRLLWLSSSQVTDSGLKHLAALKNLSHLDLRDTSVTDNGLGELSGLKRLDTLILDGTRVTDEGLKHLEGMHCLKHLSVRRTELSPDGVAELERVLPGQILVVYRPVRVFGTRRRMPRQPDLR
jgi:hypothetical protein